MPYVLSSCALFPMCFSCLYVTQERRKRKAAVPSFLDAVAEEEALGEIPQEDNNATNDLETQPMCKKVGGSLVADLPDDDFGHIASALDDPVWHENGIDYGTIFSSTDFRLTARQARPVGSSPLGLSIPLPSVGALVG